MLSSDYCAILAAGNVSRSACHFPSSAAVEGKRHFRFSPLRVAAGCRLCTREKGHVGLSPRVSIPCPCLYGLIRSRLHARGRCELSSASAGFMSLPSGGRSEWGPHVGIPLDTFHSVTSVGLPPYLEGPAVSVALDSLYDPVRLHTPICSQPPPPLFQGGSSYCSYLQCQRGFCPATGSLFSSAQRSNRRGLLYGSTPWLLQLVFSSSKEGWGFASYTRFVQAELLPLQREIQDADAQEHSFPGQNDLKDAHFHIQVVQRHRKFLRFAFGGKANQYKVLPFGLALAPRTFTKCMDAALAPQNPQLPGRLAYFSQLQGTGASSQGSSPSPPSCAWPPAEWPEECAHPSPADHFFGSLPGLNLDAGPSGPCSGREHSVVRSPRQV